MYVNINQAAKILDISVKATRRYVASGLLKAEFNKGIYVIRQTDLDKFKTTIPVAGRLLDESIQGNSDTVWQREWVDVSSVWNSPPRTAFTFVDLFSGAGGLSLGLKWSGMEGICGLDWFRAATETYASYFSHPIINGDITKASIKELFYKAVKGQLQGRELDLVAGGFPCQGFSMAGHRIADDPRNSLYKELLKIVDVLRPRYLLFENVKGIRSMLKGEVVKKIISDVRKLGYEMHFETLMAADYYTPQKRERVIFIGNRIDAPILFPKPILEEKDYITTGDAISDLITHPYDPEFNHLPTKHSQKMIERLKAVKPGESLYENYSDAWKRCVWNEPSCTIKENHGGVNIHPTLPRVLTPREMARLQSFPDDFIFSGSKSEQLVQIGNAVPPLLGKAVGLAILKSNQIYKESNL